MEDPVTAVVAQDVGDAVHVRVLLHRNHHEHPAGRELLPGRFDPFKVITDAQEETVNKAA